MYIFLFMVYSDCVSDRFVVSIVGVGVYTAFSLYSADMLAVVRLEYEFNRWPILTYCTLNYST